MSISQTRYLQPMGFRLRLDSNSPAILAAAETSFGRFGPTQPSESPDFTFRFFEHDLDDGPPGKPVFKMEGPLFYQSTGRDSTLAGDVERGLAYGYFSPATVADEVAFRWNFLELAFFRMLEGRGLMGVHGAALVKNGRAILLRAQSGGGKTTLAYAAARSRYQALAEDVVWLDQTRGRWWGMPWSFHLLPDARQLFPELAGYEPVLQTNREMKLEVDLETIRPGSTTVSAEPGPVVFVERLPGGQSRLEPISAAEARALWPAAHTGMEMTLPHHAACLERLLLQPVYRFYFGDDIERGVDLLEELFE